MNECNHPEFDAAVDIQPLNDNVPEGTPAGTVPAESYAVEITVSCRVCARPLRWFGPVGISTITPMVSVDGRELRAPATMTGEQPRPITATLHER